MTRDEILAMTAGRELDKLVAEKCLGLEVLTSANNAVCDYYSPQINIKGRSELPFYSTDLNAAWDALGGKYELTLMARAGKMRLHTVLIYRGYGKTTIEIRSENPSEAICKAALLAEMGL